MEIIPINLPDLSQTSKTSKNLGKKKKKQRFNPKWWKKTKNAVLVKDLENIKSNLKNNIQPRLSWEVNLLKIGMEIN